jgi:nucleotide-binding universal stress UspA family protein
MRPCRAILVPVDFTAASQRALAYARDLAARCRAALHVLHVVEDPFAGEPYMSMIVRIPDGYFEQIEARTLDRLTTFAAGDAGAETPAVIGMRIGDPSTQILDYLQNHQEIDLVVMATEGQGDIARFAIGSVADRLLRASPRPVLTLNPNARTRLEDMSRAA